MSAPKTKHDPLLDGKSSEFNEHLEDGNRQGQTIAVVGCRDGEQVTGDLTHLTPDLEAALCGATGLYCLVTPTRDGDGYEVEPTDRVEEIQRIKEPKQVLLILQDDRNWLAGAQEAMDIAIELGVAVSGWAS